MFPTCSGLNFGGFDVFGFGNLVVLLILVLLGAVTTVFGVGVRQNFGWFAVLDEFFWSRMGFPEFWVNCCFDLIFWLLEGWIW